MTAAYDPQHYRLRAPCKHCGCEFGRMESKGGQDTVRCLDCDKHLYNAPRTETGKEQRSVSTVHDGIKTSQRARILARAGFRCEFCGKTKTILHVDHLIPVKEAMLDGWTDAQINDDENLASACEECNLGRGRNALPLRTVLAFYMRRMKEQLGK